MGKISACERTNVSTTSNYRGELLGALLSSHIICIASEFSGSMKPSHLYCDNMGVIHHAHPDAKLKANHTQSDILAALECNLTNATLPREYHHVYGHMDATVEYSQLTLAEQLNVLINKLATVCLEKAHAMGEYCTLDFPNEFIRLLVNGQKVTSSVIKPVYTNFGDERLPETCSIKSVSFQESTSTM